MYYLTDNPDKQYHIGKRFRTFHNAHWEAKRLSEKMGVTIYVMLLGNLLVSVYVVGIYNPAQASILDKLDDLRKRHDKALFDISEIGEGEVQCLIAFLILLICGVLGLWWIDVWVGR